MPAVGAVLPMAVYTSQFDTLWRSFRTAPLTWSKPSQYMTNTDLPDGFTNGFSAGSPLTDLAGKVGGLAGGFPLYFMGQGHPATPQLINPTAISNTDNIGTLDYFDMTQGAWWIGSAWYLIVTDYNSGSSLTMIKGTPADVAFPNDDITWEVKDQSNQPSNPDDSSAIFWDGTSTDIHVFCAEPNSSNGEVVSSKPYPFPPDPDNGGSENGNNYVIGDVVNIVGGSSDGLATAQVTSISAAGSFSGGGITGLTILTGGSGYDGTTLYHTTGGSGSGPYSGGTQVYVTVNNANDSALRTFDTTTDTWSSPFAVLSGIPGRQIHFTTANSTNSNGLYKFPNGDFGVLYTVREVLDGLLTELWNNIYYRLYSSGSWGSEVVVASASDQGHITSATLGNADSISGNNSFVAGNTYDIQQYSGSGGFYTWNYTATGATALVTSVDGSGAITGFTLASAGSGYTGGKGVIVQPGYGYPAPSGLAAVQGAKITVDVDVSSQFCYLGSLVHDLSAESLHVFYLHSTGSKFGTITGIYTVVEHDGTLHGNCFQFPTRTTGSDSFGNPIIVNDSGTIRLLVPYDDFAAVNNAAWEGEVTGDTTTFYEGLIPTGAPDVGATPSCAYLCYGQFVPGEGGGSFCYAFTKYQHGF